ncbi:MAG: hypothetical protein ACLQPH_06645 [Acidimicrobiales bacterium]
MRALPSVHDPGGRSLRKAARTSVVMSASFFFGVHVVHNSQFAIIATFTAAAILGIADFSGRRALRLRATAGALAVGAVLLALGTAVSQYTVAAAVTMTGGPFWSGSRRCSAATSPQRRARSSCSTWWRPVWRDR